MTEPTALSQSIEAVTDNEKYDHNIKNILANKSILAWILKFTIDEFRSYDIDTIIACIEQEPEVGSVSVYPGKTNVTFEKIKGMSTEDKVQNEGEIYYDIRFSTYTPNKQPVKLIINIEAQKSFYPGYDLVTRAIFYCARSLSAQLNTEFTSSQYDDIKKVYSIWICMDTSKVTQNTITIYEIKPRRIHGNSPDIFRYDIMSAVMICVGDEPLEDNEGSAELIQLLKVILDGTLSPKEKERILEEQFSIKATRELIGGLENMCNLSMLVEERGIAKGITKGVEKGEAATIVRLIDNFMNRNNASLLAACEIMGVMVEEYNSAKELLTSE